jgi:hypothetical protein
LWLDHRIDRHSEELFGLWARDEAPPIDRHLDRPEWDPLFEILERLAGASPGCEGFEGRQFGVGDWYTQKQVGARPVGGLAEETLGLVPREVADGGDEISGISWIPAQFSSFLESPLRSGQGKDAAEVRKSTAGTCDLRPAAGDSRLLTLAS